MSEFKKDQGIDLSKDKLAVQVCIRCLSDCKQADKGSKWFSILPIRMFNLEMFLFETHTISSELFSCVKNRSKKPLVP